MPRLNIQAHVRSYLAGRLGVPVSVAVPSPRPASFVTVRREGGSRQNGLVDRPGVGLEMWAATEAEAASLAAEVGDLMYELGRTGFPDGVADVAEEAMYSDADAETGSPRWYASYTITTYKS